MKLSYILVASMLVILAAGIGIGWGFQTTVLPGGSVSTTASQGQGPASITLVITTQNTYNSTAGAQPAYYVLTPKGLESSANIALPANALIKLTIINYDDGNGSLIDPQYANVQGTVNGTITYFSNSNVNSTEGPKGIVLNGGQTVTSVPPAILAHTFSIPSLKINIPVPLSSTVVAYIEITQPGTYGWFCYTACGSGPAGTWGAMDTPGWMTGNLEAS